MNSGKITRYLPILLKKMKKQNDIPYTWSEFFFCYQSETTNSNISPPNLASGLIAASIHWMKTLAINDINIFVRSASAILFRILLHAGVLFLTFRYLNYGKTRFKLLRKYILCFRPLNLPFVDINDNRRTQKRVIFYVNHITPMRVHRKSGKGEEKAST